VLLNEPRLEALRTGRIRGSTTLPRTQQAWTVSFHRKPADAEREKRENKNHDLM
jgi:hypothetical protein